MVKSAGILYFWLYSFNWCSCKWNSTVKKSWVLGPHRSKNDDYSFWVLKLCSLKNKYQHFRKTGCLYKQGNNVFTETVLSVVGTSNR